MKAIQISGLRQMQIVSVPEQELHFASDANRECSRTGVTCRRGTSAS